MTNKLTTVTTLVCFFSLLNSSLKKVDNEFSQTELDKKLIQATTGAAGIAGGSLFGKIALTSAIARIDNQMKGIN